MEVKIKKSTPELKNSPESPITHWFWHQEMWVQNHKSKPESYTDSAVESPRTLVATHPILCKHKLSDSPFTSLLNCKSILQKN